MTGTGGPASHPDSEITLTTVRLTLCSPCLSGEGGECHTPGCDLWMNRAPDIPLWPHVMPFDPDEDN